jgi:type IV pilus assembly protein PilM
MRSCRLDRRSGNLALGLMKPKQIALDIGGSSLVAVEVGGAGDRLKLRGCWEWPLSEGLVVDGEIVDADLFARELRAFANHNKLRNRMVQVSVSNQKVIVRNVDMPDMTEDELRGAIEFQAQDYIPIPVEEAVMDFQVVGKRTNADGASRQEVLLVAAQSNMVATLHAAIKQAGLRVAGIDVSSMALVRALIPPAPFMAATVEGGLCKGIVDIGSSVSTLVIAVDGVVKFTRVINYSSDKFARVLSEQRSIPLGDAHVLAQQIGLSGPTPADNTLYAQDVIDDTRRRLGEVATELSEEIRRSLHYYEGQERAASLSELILSGRGALVRNLDSHLAEALSMRVSVGNPLLLMAENSSNLSDADLAFMSPYLSVAVGLALPEEE